jgi:hypothetical protein
MRTIDRRRLAALTVFAGLGLSAGAVQKVDQGSQLTVRLSGLREAVISSCVVGAGCQEHRLDLRGADAGLNRYFPLADTLRLVDLEELPGLAALQSHGGPISVRFLHSPDVRISAPWHLLTRSDTETHYRSTPPHRDWSGRIAIGQLSLHSLQLAGGELRVAITPGDPQPNQAQWLDWLQRGMEASAAVYGRFPLPSVQVLVIPVGESRGEVPWGQVMRGGAAAMHLFVDQTDPYPDLLDDWTLFHELSHLYLPLVRRDDAWLSEGLASYYQTVARVRSGLIDAGTGWAKLRGGMDNGIEQANPGLTYREAMAGGGWSRTRLMYWIGAAVFLRADIALRTRSDNVQSLDQVLGEFQRCCLPSRELWSADRLLGRFDEIVGRPLFRPIAQETLGNRGFPNIDHDLAAIGISRRTDGAMRIEPGAPLAGVARAIMGHGAIAAVVLAAEAPDRAGSSADHALATQ